MRLVYLFILILSMSSVSPSNDWPMFMHDLQRTGSALGAAPDTAYLLWEYDAETPMAASPVEADGKVFRAARGKMVALQADTR